MPIHVPGKRKKRGRKGGSKRSAVAPLNMTAMVDMFTVLCVFLLQNYATTNQVLPMPEKVDLPAAHEVRELKPSNVVVVSPDGIVLNNIKVADFVKVKVDVDRFENSVLAEKFMVKGIPSLVVITPAQEEVSRALRAQGHRHRRGRVLGRIERCLHDRKPFGRVAELRWGQIRARARKRDGYFNFAMT